MLIHEFDHVERVENDLGLWQIFPDGGGIGAGHIHRDGLDAGAGAAQASPERSEGFHVTAFSDVYDGSRFKIKDEGPVSELPSKVDFINGDLLEMFKRRFTELALQLLFVDVLDDGPCVSDVFGDVFERRGQLDETEDRSFEGTAVGLVRIGETNDSPTETAAIPATNAGHLDDGVAEFSFEPGDANGPGHNSIAGDILRPTDRASGLRIMEVVVYLVSLALSAYEIIVA